MLDVNWGDLIDYFGDDPRTHSIVIYMESIGDASSFLSAAREVSLTKPIIVIKAGRTAAAAQGRRLAHRFADRLRRGAGSGLPPRRSAARQLHCGDLFHDRGAGQAAASQGQPAVHCDQRGRAGRAGHRRADPGRRRTGRAVAGEHGGLQRHSAAGVEPQQSGGHSGRRRARPLRQVAGDCREGPEHRRDAGDHDAAGDDQSHADRRAAQALCPRTGQAGAGQLDGRRIGGAGRGDSQPGGNPQLPLSRYRGAGLQLHVALHLQPARTV